MTIPPSFIYLFFMLFHLDVRPDPGHACFHLFIYLIGSAHAPVGAVAPFIYLFISFPLRERPLHQSDRSFHLFIYFSIHFPTGPATHSMPNLSFIYLFSRQNDVDIGSKHACCRLFIYLFF